MVNVTEVKKAVAACRKALKEGNEHLSIGNLSYASREYERAQRYAFQAKDLTRNGGRFDSEEI